MDSKDAQPAGSPGRTMFDDASRMVVPVDPEIAKIHMAYRMQMAGIPRLDRAMVILSRREVVAGVRRWLNPIEEYRHLMAVPVREEVLADREAEVLAGC